MGFFSWRCAKTGKSIPNMHSGRASRPVYVLQPGKQGNVRADAYDGYGVFAGIDMHEWLAVQNAEALGLDIGGVDDFERARILGIKMAMGDVLVNPKTGDRWSIIDDARPLVGGNFFPGNYAEIIPIYGLSANDCVKQGILEKVAISDLIEIPFPIKLSFEDVPYESVGASEPCPNQGFFY